MSDPSILNIIGDHVKTVISQADLAIVPFGSIEYHGPHAPMGTDSLIAQEVASRVASRLNAVLYPLVAFTTCPISTRSNPGSVSVEPGTMISYTANIFRNLLQQGFKGILALNAHDGNILTIQLASERVYFDFPDQFILTVNWWETLPVSQMESLGFFSNEGGHGHGGPLETSAAWAAQSYPGTVDLSKARDIDVSSFDQPVVSILNPGKSPSDWQGYHGRVSESSFEKGQTLLNLSADKIVEFVRKWLVDYPNPGEKG